MNAEQQHKRLAVDNVDAPTTGSGGDPAWSALADGELDAADIRALLASIEGSPEGLSEWHAYQVIGDVLRGNADPTGKRPATDFLAAVRIGLDARDSWTEELAHRPAVANMPVARVRAQAANEEVFRWKLVAGMASLAAVVAVSWTMLAGSGADPNGSAGAQLAVAPPASVAEPALAVNTPGAPGAVPVMVGTGQGILIRDAQLEALLAEHRQHGGMSALQMPSGFIRNATYEAAGR